MDNHNPDPGQEEAERWEAWKSDLLDIMRKAGWHNTDPRDYRDYFDDNYSPQDAWDEDMRHHD